MIDIIKKTKILFNRKEKVLFVGIVILMIIGAFLETLGVSLIVPIMSVILNPNFFYTNKIVKIISHVMRIKSSDGFIRMTLIVLMLAFIVKNIFIYYEYYCQQLFITNSKAIMQKKIFATILKKPYQFFTATNTGNIQRNVMSDVAGAYALVGNLMSFFSEIIVCFVIILTMMFIDPVMCIVVGITIFVEMLTIAKFIKPVMSRIGVTQRGYMGQMNRWIIEAVEGIKDIKISEKDEFFIDNYAVLATDSAHIERKNNVLSNLPRLLIEAVTISVMIVFVIILLNMGHDINDMIPQISAFAVAAIRLLPSANRISASINMMPYNRPMLNSLVDTLKSAEGKILVEQGDLDNNISFENECLIENISFKYDDSDENILNDVTIRIKRGESVGIIGPSGAGKTTFVDIILGLLKPQKGRIFVDGFDIEKNLASWHKIISYIPQNIFMIDDTIASNIAFGDKVLIDRQRIISILKDVKMWDYVCSLPDGIDTRIGERGTRLSGGQRQRIGIARALYSNPEVIVFDEATSALDNETEAAIMDSINALHGRKTLIIIAHRLSTINNCDRIYRVEDKKVSCVKE